MSRKWIVLLLFILFVLEGTVVPWLIPGSWQTNVQVVPRFVLVVVLFAAVYLNRHYGLVLGLVFGLLQDLLYMGHMLGVNAFSMGFTGYLLGLLFRRRPAGIVLMMFICLLGNLLFDSAVYGTYRMFNVVKDPFYWAFMHHILPSLFINLLFGLIVYLPVRKLLEASESGREEESA